jgi:hypothetical protein
MTISKRPIYATQKATRTPCQKSQNTGASIPVMVDKSSQSMFVNDNDNDEVLVITHASHEIIQHQNTGLMQLNSKFP